MESYILSLKQRSVLYPLTFCLSSTLTIELRSLITSKLSNSFCKLFAVFVNVSILTEQAEKKCKKQMCKKRLNYRTLFNLMCTNDVFTGLEYLVLFSF